MSQYQTSLTSSFEVDKLKYQLSNSQRENDALQSKAQHYQKMIRAFQSKEAELVNENINIQEKLNMKLQDSDKKIQEIQNAFEESMRDAENAAVMLRESQMLIGKLEQKVNSHQKAICNLQAKEIDLLKEKEKAEEALCRLNEVHSLTMALLEDHKKNRANVMLLLKERKEENLRLRKLLSDASDEAKLNALNAQRFKDEVNKKRLEIKEIKEILHEKNFEIEHFESLYQSHKEKLSEKEKALEIKDAMEKSLRNELARQGSELKDLRNSVQRFDDEKKVFESKMKSMIKSQEKKEKGLRNVNKNLVKKLTQKGTNLKQMQAEVMRFDDKIKKEKVKVEKMENIMNARAFDFVEFEHLRADLKCSKIENQRLKVKAEDQIVECAICLDNAVDCMLLPCRHVVTCMECAGELKTCTHCYEAVNDVKKFRNLLFV